MVNIGDGHSTYENESQTVRDMASKVDGLIVMARSLPDAELAFLRKRVPLTLIANVAANSEEGSDVVRVSNRKGMHVLIDHLIEKHHITHFAYFTGQDNSPDNRKRYEGFCEALNAHNINSAAAPIYRGEFSQEIAMRITEGLIEQHLLPQALVCANDQMALGALKALQRSHIDVPGTVIVTGFDGIQETDTATPRLTTVCQPMVDLGRASVATMVKRIEHPELPPIATILPVTVQLRESCEGPFAEDAND